MDFREDGPFFFFFQSAFLRDHFQGDPQCLCSCLHGQRHANLAGVVRLVVIEVLVKDGDGGMKGGVR